MILGKRDMSLSGSRVLGSSLTPPTTVVSEVGYKTGNSRTRGAGVSIYLFTVEQLGRVVLDVAHVFGDLEGLHLVRGERA